MLLFTMAPVWVPTMTPLVPPEMMTTGDFAAEASAELRVTCREPPGRATNYELLVLRSEALLRGVVRIPGAIG